jgi:hypothetical protein
MISYADSAVLMQDVEFRGRIKVAILRYADYIMAESPAAAAHFTRVRWAQNAVQNPEGAAQQVQPSVVMDTAVQQDGAAIADAQLQVAVETTVNKFL